LATIERLYYIGSNIAYSHIVAVSLSLYYISYIWLLANWKCLITKNVSLANEREHNALIKSNEKIKVPQRPIGVASVPGNMPHPHPHPHTHISTSSSLTSTMLGKYNFERITTRKHNHQWVLRLWRGEWRNGG